MLVINDELIDANISADLHLYLNFSGTLGVRFGVRFGVRSNPVTHTLILAIYGRSPQQSKIDTEMKT